MKFYSAIAENRPIYSSESTRKFAFDSLEGKYGQDTRNFPHVKLDDIENFEELTLLEKYDIAIERIVHQAPIRICENELISGAATIGDAIDHMIPAAYKGQLLCYSVSHVTLGFDRVVNEGLLTIEEEVKTAIATQDDSEKLTYLKSMQHSIDCFKIWHECYLNELVKKDEEIYKRSYENLKQVPLSPASNFHEAVQSLWFAFAFTRLTGNWSGIGRIDYILGKYLEQDLNQGVLDLSQAREILAHFFIKGCEWIYGGSNGSGDAQHYQNIVLAGVDEDGNEITNNVTYLCLDIVEEFGISDFPIAVRINKNSPQKLLKRVAEVIRHGNGTVAVYNEELITNSLTDFIYDINEARNFANDGCWEVQIPGKTYFRYIPFDGLNILQHQTLQGYKNAELNFATFDELFSAYIDDLKARLEQIYQDIEGDYIVDENINYKNWKWKPRNPCSVISLFTEGCAKKGLSYLEGGAKYNVLSFHIGGLPDTANSLYAIKKIVFDEKRLALAEFMRILRDDWNGEETLRQHILNRYAYYGNDNPEVDEVAARIADRFADIVKSFNGRCPLYFIPGISTFGRQIEWAASRISSPHGHKKGDVLANNFSPTPGSDFVGATAIIKSHCTTNLRNQTCGAALDLKLSPTTIKASNGIDSIVGLINGFINLGGFFLQIDVLDNEVLKSAQEHPEDYKNLAVRIAGWSARFVTLDKEWQDMIIKRDSSNVS